GEGVGNLREAAGEARYRDGCGREVRVQVADPSPPHLAGKHGGLADGQGVYAPRRLELAPHAGQGGRRVLESGPQVHGLYAVGGEVADRGAHVGDRVLEMRVVGREQGEDFHVEPRRLV